MIIFKYLLLSLLFNSRRQSRIKRRENKKTKRRREKTKTRRQVRVFGDVRSCEKIINEPFPNTANSPELENKKFFI
jgi:hypothetical protein